VKEKYLGKRNYKTLIDTNGRLLNTPFMERIQKTLSGVLTSQRQYDKISHCSHVDSSERCVSGRAIWNPDRRLLMKLHHLASVFLMGCIAFLALQTVSAQNRLDASAEVIATYDEDAICFDEAMAFYCEDAAYFDAMMAFYFGDEFAFFGLEDFFAPGLNEPPAQTMSVFPSQCGPPMMVSGRQHTTLNNAVVLDWRRGTGANPVAYYIYRNGNYIDMVIPSSSQTAFSHVLTNMPVGRNNYGVAALDSNWRPSARVDVPVTVQAPPPPPPSGQVPRLDSVVQIGNVLGGQARVELKWTYVPSATTYNIYRSTGGAWTRVWSGVGWYTGVGTTITTVEAIISCPPGTYMFAVTSVSGGKESDRSGPRVITIR